MLLTTRQRERQDAQELALHEAHDEPDEDVPEAVNEDISFLTRPDPHAAHFGRSADERMSSSNSFPHFLHSYS
jgi:hypothetical protein